jgi:glycosyltransferase involved in cell wall biosynthesis
MYVTALRYTVSNPSLAVLILAYKDESTIQEALESVFSQDYQGRIVVRFALDRGSTDRTHSIVREYVDAHSRDHLEWVLSYHDHKSMLGARRWLVPQVQEDYAFHLDADNVWFHFRIRRHMEQHPPERNRAVCGTNYLLRRAMATAPAVWIGPLLIGGVPEGNGDIDTLLKRNIMDTGAVRIEGRYLHERLVPALNSIDETSPDAGLVDGYFTDDYFMFLVAARDRELCSHSGEGLWIYRLVGKRPWEDPDRDRRLLAASRLAFRRWADKNPPLDGEARR